MRKIIYISVLCTFFFVGAQAQKKYIYQDTSLLQKEGTDNNDENETTVTTDKIVESATAKAADTALYINNLLLSPDSITQWKKLKQYSYIKSLDSLLREKNKKTKVKPVRRDNGPGFFSKLLTSPLLRIILWMLAISFIVFIIYKLFLTEGIFKAKTKAADKPGTKEPEETITSETDFDELIKNALQQNNYRQAVRYQYLRTLHLLARKNLIELAPDKTNYQYVSEIKERAYQNDFAALTLNYEYVWYGEFNIENDIYGKIETGFINLNKKI